MRVAIYDRIEPIMPAQLPLRLTQTCSPSGPTATLAVVAPVALAAVVTGLALVYQALLMPAARELIGRQPTLGLEVLVALVFFIALIALPVRRLLARLATTRTVEIARGLVTVTEGGYFCTWSWSAPLTSYAGLTHHVRASLSGTRHELILVHPQREKSVLLCVAPKTSQNEVDRVAALLGHKQIPPGELYRFKGLWPRLAANPLPDAAHA
jgi:hypothetical protein